MPELNPILEADLEDRTACLQDLIQELKRAENAYTAIKADIQKEVLAPLEYKIKALEARVAATLRDSGVGKCTVVVDVDGKPQAIQAAMVERIGAKATDWEALWQWILATGNVHYIKKGVVSSVVAEQYVELLKNYERLPQNVRAEVTLQAFIEDNMPPGLQATTWEELSLTKGTMPKARSSAR